MTLQIANIIALPDLQYLGSQASSSAYAIANDGEIGGGSNGGATVWLGRAPTGLGALSGYAFSEVDGINDKGQAVGYSAQDFADLSHATLWQNGTAIAIGNPQDASMANAINDQGQVVGVAGPAGGVDSAFVWQNGVLTYLPNLPGITNTYSGVYDGDAYAINQSGQIVGTALDSKGVDHAVLWQNGTITDLGAPDGTTVATALNNQGQVVGYSGYNAFLWQNGKMTILPHVGNTYFYADAEGINDAGIAVGFDTTFNSNLNTVRHAVVWQNGTAIDLNTLLPSAYSNLFLTQAFAINDNNQILVSGSDGRSYVVTLGSSQIALTAATALQASSTGTLAAATLVQDSAANIQNALDALETPAAAGKIASIALTDQTTPTLSVSAAQLAADAAVLQDIDTPYHLTVTGAIPASALTSESGDHLSGIVIRDNAAGIAANINDIEGLANGGGLTSIQLTDGGTATLTIPDALTTYAKALAAISGSYQLNLTNASAATAAADAAQPHVVSIAVNDIGNSVGAHLDDLQALAMAGKLDGITLRPGAAVSNADNISVLVVTPDQTIADAAAIAKISGSFSVEIDVPAASQTVKGVTGEANSAVFTGAASFYLLTPSDGGLTVRGNGATDSLSGVQAVVFSDTYAIIAQAPGSDGHVTTGNITELYSAVLAREPDLPGLSFYQNYLAANPGTSLLQFAQWFLASPEYSQNPAHAYAQTTAGETQFITDSYQNLLHRTPSADELAFYQTKVIQPALNGLTPGTTTYGTADARAHAQLLVYFSASPEFLSDVQIAAGTSASAQHWLLLI